jgi:hypothetical protein|tara:strand:+ start:4342 stop:4896 length:555 start_codon:yes stop_codon:yes gene_type:complete
MKLLNIVLLILSLIILSSCGALKYKKVSAKDYPPDPKERIKKNMEEGRGFRLMDTIRKDKSGKFDFASSNPLWRATLDTISFMPLMSANYSGGIIITDWYSDNSDKNESVKISIRFLSNEVRSDALDIKLFIKQCSVSINNCKITENTGSIVKELNKSILRKAAIYEKQFKNKNKKEYIQDGKN